MKNYYLLKLKVLAKLFSLLLLAGTWFSSNAQMNYNYTFAATGTSGWTGNGSRTTTAVCGTTGSIRFNIYSGSPTMNFVSPVLVAEGQLVTVSYSTKCVQFSPVTTGAAANTVTTKLQWATSTAGPWTDVAGSDFPNVLSTTCVQNTATFTPGVGNIYVRFNTVLVNTSGDVYLYLDDISITSPAPPPCSGTPAPGNTLAAATSVCTGSNVSLSLQNATLGSGVTYQWQSSPDGGSYTDIASATSSTYSGVFNAATYYQCNVTCAGTTTASAPVQVTPNAFYNCYCSSAATSTADEEILGVTLNSVAKTSTCAALPASTTGTLNMYTNWRGQGSMTTVQQYSSYPLSLDLGTCGGTYGRSAKVYIDYNCDGDFADAGEEVYSTGAIASSVANPVTYSTTITIPGTAGPLLTASNTTQVTGMRVVYYETTLGATAYCGAPASWGETEDFLVTLEYAPPCAGVNNPGATTASTVLACSGQAVTLGITTPTTGATTSYQWYADGNAIANATGTTYSTTVNGSVSYYCTVTCGTTTTSSSSTPITVNQDIPTNCYCVPTISLGCTDGDVIARVILNTLDNNSGTGCPVSSGYANYTTTPALTTTLQAASTYNCTVYAGQYAEGYAAWIDYNDDGVFDNATERIGYSNGTVAGSGQVGVLGSSATFPISLSCTPPSGQHRLRVRAMYATSGVNVTPCTNNSYGEVEDYLITIAPAPVCPAPGAMTTVTTGSYTADLSFPLGCSNATNFDFEYGPAGFTLGTGTQVLNQAATISAGTGTYTLTGLSPLTTYDVYYRANCGADLSPWSINPTSASTLEPPCSGTPNTSTASFVGASTICDGLTALLTTSGYSTGVLQLSNAWEVSTNNVNWSAVSGATLPTYQTNAMTAGTYYFRYSTTCLVSSETATSNVIELTVLAPPTVAITAPNNGTFCGTQTLSVSGASTYSWTPSNVLSANTGSSVTFTGTANASITVTGTDVNGCIATSAPYAITYSAPDAVTYTASAAGFCGTGGTSSIAVASTNANYSYTFTTLGTGVVSNTTANSFDFAITETSSVRVDAVDAISGCATQNTITISVYPLPTSNVTASSTDVCPGTSVTINTGLSAQNFTSTAIPFAALTAPVDAVTLVTGGLATPATDLGFGLDDGGWSAIPVGFNFNFFGAAYNTVSVGTNGTVFMGNTGNVSDFTFTTLPSTTEPFNMVAVLAMDNNLGSVDGGTIKYWTEGTTPNRKFVISYENVKEYADTKYSTSQAIFYETTGIVEVHVTSSTNVDRNKLVGINNGDGTEGVLAYASGTTASATNPIANPFAYRFSPPANFTTVWTATTNGISTEIANGTNIFSQVVTVNDTTTYSISYTNQTTGCTNVAGSAQVTVNTLGTVAPSGVNVVAPSEVCFGTDFTLTTDYTGILNGLTFQWQSSVDNGPFVDIAGANSATLTTNQLDTTVYHLLITSCGGTAIATNDVTITLTIPTNCYCTPLYTTGTSSGDLISHVEIEGTTLDNNTGFVTGTPSYVLYTGQPNYTATLLPSSTYIVNVSTGEWGDEGVAAWIDYNDDGVFAPSERIGATPTTIGTGYTQGQVNDSSSFTISLACTPPTGIHRMRVRMVYAQNGINIDPCATYTYGETEDYFVNILPPPTCPSTGIMTVAATNTTSVDLAWALGCSTASTFDLEYGPAGFTLGSGTVVSGVTPTINGTNAAYTLAGLVPNTSYSVYVRANCGNGDVSTWSLNSDFATPCAPISLNNPGNQIVCSSYTLPAITESVPSNNAGLQLSYFTQANGTGLILTGAITTSQTVYIYASAGACVAQENFTVTVNQPSTSSTTLTQCSSYAWNGQTYTASGTYTYTTPNAVGCDSTATLVLTITQPTTSTLNVLACQSYTLNTQTYTTSGSYTQVLQNVAGCDSTITLNLTVGAPETLTVPQTACDTYTWNGTAYTTSGQYSYTYQNIYGCDSVVTLDLTINNSNTSTTTQLSCTPYSWNGQTYTSSGTYVYNTQNVSGCDSTATLILTIGNNGSTSTATTCGSFTWTNGQTYTATGTYTQTLTNVNGCDSVLTLNLTINPLPVATATDNGNGVLTSSTGSAYQWIDCATNTSIAGATQQSYTVTDNGSYAVIVTNANNCSATSSCVVVDYIGLVENGDLSLNVYPNPTTGNINIAINGTTANYNVSVEDMNGRVVAEYGQLIHGNGVYNLNLTKVVTGVYFIKLKNGSEQKTVRVIVQ